MKIYTRRGDDGTTSLKGKTRVAKNSALVELNGTIDEAQASLGMVRALCTPGDELNELLAHIEEQLWVVMSEVASRVDAPQSLGQRRSTDRRSRQDPPGVTAEMVSGLEDLIDRFVDRTEIAPHFAVPGDSAASAALDFARTVVRRSERLAVGVMGEGSFVLGYLNRLSDLCFALARFAETNHRVIATRRVRSTDEMEPHGDA